MPPHVSVCPKDINVTNESITAALRKLSVSEAPSEGSFYKHLSNFKFPNTEADYELPPSYTYSKGLTRSPVSSACSSSPKSPRRPSHKRSAPVSISSASLESLMSDCTSRTSLSSRKSSTLSLQSADGNESFGTAPLIDLDQVSKPLKPRVWSKMAAHHHNSPASHHYTILEVSEENTVAGGSPPNEECESENDELELIEFLMERARCQVAGGGVQGISGHANTEVYANGPCWKY